MINIAISQIFLMFQCKGEKVLAERRSYALAEDFSRDPRIFLLAISTYICLNKNLLQMKSSGAYPAMSEIVAKQLSLWLALNPAIV